MRVGLLPKPVITFSDAGVKKILYLMLPAMFGASVAQINLLLDELLHLHPKKIDLSLDRTFRLLEKLGNPQKKIKNSVMCSGTNGKFSTLNFIREILRYNNKTGDFNHVM